MAPTAEFLEHMAESVTGLSSAHMLLLTAAIAPITQLDPLLMDDFQTAHHITEDVLPKITGASDDDLYPIANYIISNWVALGNHYQGEHTRIYRHLRTAATLVERAQTYPFFQGRSTPPSVPGGPGYLRRQIEAMRSRHPEAINASLITMTDIPGILP